MSMSGIYTKVLLVGYRGILRPILFTQDPERIHEWTIGALSIIPKPLHGLIRLLLGKPNDPVVVAGVRFPGRVGVAAGLDKDGHAASIWGAMGFGFAELGTVTAQEQPGNDLPRSFRLAKSQALLNRMGFNNHGAATLAETLLAKGFHRGANPYPVGISIGKTKVVPLEEAVGDYLLSLDAVAPFADYVAINVSSPNTPQLRELQSDAKLRELVSALVARAKDLNPENPVPLFVKVSPDESLASTESIIAICESEGISGIIATNTTLARDGIAPADAQKAEQTGGLSGVPLTAPALERVQQITSRTSLPVMASGGIMTPHDAQAALDAGAVLVQVFTGFIFNGPALIRGINTTVKGH
jgi:dihydroorotate dehydrogenase